MFHRFLVVTWLLPLLLVVSEPPLAWAQEGIPDTPVPNGFAEQGSATAECLPSTRLPFNDPPAEPVDRRLAGEGQAARDQVVHRAAEAEQIAPAVHLPPARLLG